MSDADSVCEDSFQEVARRFGTQRRGVGAATAPHLAWIRLVALNTALAWRRIALLMLAGFSYRDMAQLSA